MIKQAWLVVLFLLPFSYVWSQNDKLYLINGSIVTGKISYLGADTITFITKKNKTISFDKYRVFSVEYEEGKKQIIYNQDTSKGRDYSVREMELFMLGGQDARNHKTVFPFVVGTLLGGVGGYVSAGSFLVVGVPFVSMIGTAVITMPFTGKGGVRNKEWLKDENYRRGYKRAVKGKKNNQIIWGSFIGTLAGFAISTLENR